MAIHLSFLGAARNVTGSRTLVEVDGFRLLVDCGLHQEREYRVRDWDPFPTPPDELGAVLLTHAHLDHCGFLPRLVRQGFRGPIYATDAALEIAKIVLLDSAHIQEEDARYKKRRHRREKRKSPFGYEPLYRTEHAEKAISQMTPVPYGQPVKIHDGIEAVWHEAGHILGSASVELRLRTDGGSRSLLLSGDLGRKNTPILRDPAPPDKMDWVVVESTYGDRLHGPEEDVPGILAEAINHAVRAGGNIVIPSFAIGRTQELLYHLNALLEENRIPPLPVFVDSPMAVRVTRVFAQHPKLFDQEMTEFLLRRESPFDFHGLNLVVSVHQSKAINNVRGTAVIIAGSGMCTGGRIKHHLVHNIHRPESTLLFVGYQARGTLGRRLVQGEEEVRIFGRTYPVRARVSQVPGLSAHADRDELLTWMEGLNPRHLIVNHGEEKAALSLGETVRNRFGWKVTVPEYQDTVVLE